MKIKFALLLLLTLSFTFNLSAQKNKKKYLIGYVKDSLDRPVFNSTIFLDGKSTNVKTNDKGFFRVRIRRSPKKIMVLSPILGIQEVAYSGQAQQNIKYGRKSVNVTNRDSRIRLPKPQEKRKKSNRIFNNIYDYLIAVPGVQVINKRVVIRGIGTYNGSTDPLFVVDGSPVTTEALDLINPFNIATVTVLKGAEAANYGLRGANGVIIIKTKRKS